MLAEGKENPKLRRRVGEVLDNGARMQPQEVVDAATQLYGSRLVSSRCPDFLRRYPRRVYLSRPAWHQVREEILSTSDVKFLDAASFLGNEVEYMQRMLKKRQPNSQGYVKGIEINPWHLLMGNLMRGNSPNRMSLYMGNACDIDEFEFAGPDYIFSHGLLHSMNAKNRAGKKEKAVHLGNVGKHLRAAKKALAPGGKVVGVAFSSRGYMQPRREGGPTPIEKDDLYKLSCDAGFKHDEIYIEEKPLSHGKKGLRYQLFFVMEDHPFYL